MSKFVTLHGFGGGNSGTELNFEIVGGTTEPSNPTENMIWVNTDTPITGYRFSSTEPEDIVEGEVWICIGTDSPAAFDVVDDVTTYPLFAVTAQASTFSVPRGGFAPSCFSIEKSVDKSLMYNALSVLYDDKTSFFDLA